MACMITACPMLATPDVGSFDALKPLLAGASDEGRIGAVEPRAGGSREFHVRDPSGNLVRFGQDEP